MRLRNPVGGINFTILGTKRGEAFSTLASETYTSGASNTGWNWDKWNTFKWNTTSGTPTTFSAESDIKFLRVFERLRDIQFQISTTSYIANYVLLGLKASGRPIEMTEPSDWKLS